VKNAMQEAIDNAAETAETEAIITADAALSAFLIAAEETPAETAGDPLDLLSTLPVSETPAGTRRADGKVSPASAAYADSIIPADARLVVYASACRIPLMGVSVEGAPSAHAQGGWQRVAVCYFPQTATFHGFSVNQIGTRFSASEKVAAMSQGVKRGMFPRTGDTFEGADYPASAKAASIR